MRYGYWDAVAALAIAALWATMIYVARPLGEFPVADDWSYASSVQRLMSGGHLELHPWTPTIAFSHIVWGAIVSWCAGFSFEALRSSMYAVGLVGVLATYFTLRELALAPVVATIGALTIATDPIYFLLSGSFMTDVSFYAMATVALWGFTRTLTSDSEIGFWLATLASLVALLNRQIGLALPVGFACVYLVADRPHRFRRAATPLLLGCLALGAWQLLVPAPGGPSLFSNSKLDEAADFLRGPLGGVLFRAATNSILWLLYLGLLSVPFVVVARALARDAASPAIRPPIVLLGAMAALWLMFSGKLMPALPAVGSWLLPTGVGPLTLRDSMILELENTPRLPWIGRAALTALSIWSAAWLVHLGSRTIGAALKRRRTPASLPYFFLLAVGLLWMAPSLTSFFFDRYLLPFVPIALGLVGGSLASGVQALSRRACSGILAILFLQTCISVAAAHDYYAWNRARADATDWLLIKQHAEISSIDGGFEWNGWHLYDRSYRPTPEKSWWWVRDDEWVLSFGPIPGRREAYRVGFKRWLPPWDRGAVLVLAR